MPCPLETPASHDHLASRSSLVPSIRLLPTSCPWCVHTPIFFLFFLFHIKYNSPHRHHHTYHATVSTPRRAASLDKRPYLKPPFIIVISSYPCSRFRCRLPCTALGRRRLGPVTCTCSLGQNRS